jgi:hypothetical protein
MNEYFLIIWIESGDEIHFMILPMSEFNYVDNIIGTFSDRMTPYSVITEIMEKISKSSVENFSIQTYCTEDWIFEKYIIKKIIHLPEFGN